MPKRHQQGFTYLMLLWWVAISGVMLMSVSHSWVMASRREREAELVYRGEQIRAALQSYAKVPVSAGLSPYPKRLEDLLEDQRSGKLVRHLRQVWRDPITNQPTWGLLKTGDGIRGVYSLSLQAPIKPPDGVKSYRQWWFEADASGAAEAPAAAASGASSPFSASPAKALNAPGVPNAPNTQNASNAPDISPFATTPQADAFSGAPPTSAIQP